MLDGSHYFECQCGGAEHTLRFVLNKEDDELYTSIFLNDWQRWYKRLWVAVKYVFGYKCKYGHWDCWILRRDDAERLHSMLYEFINREGK